MMKKNTLEKHVLTRSLDKFSFLERRKWFCVDLSVDVVWFMARYVIQFTACQQSFSLTIQHTSSAAQKYLGYSYIDNGTYQ